MPQISDAIETTGIVKLSATDDHSYHKTPAIAAPTPETTAPVIPVETATPETVPVTSEVATSTSQ